MRKSFSVASCIAFTDSRWCFGKGTQSPAIAHLSEGKPEVKAFVFRIWTLTLRGEMLRKVGVGPGYTQLARDPGRCLSMSLDSARAGKTLYRAGGFS